MLKKVLTKVIFILIFLIVVVLSIIKIVLGQTYYTVGPGSITQIKRDIIPGQLIIVSGDAIYIVEASSGTILDEFSFNHHIESAIASEPDTNIIYGAGIYNNVAALFEIDRATSNVNYQNFGDGNFWATNLIQDADSIYVPVEPRSYTSSYEQGELYVFNKIGLIENAIWDCQYWPRLGIYNVYSNTLAIPSGISYSFQEGPSSLPWSDNIIQMSKIGIYDPDRSGGLLSEEIVRGVVNGISIVNDGILVAGLQTDEWDIADETPLLAVIDDPIDYWDLDGYDVLSMCADEATNRIFCILYTGNDVIGDILVWDYDTEEHYIIQTGIDILWYLEYLGGKLYCAAWNDNKIYTIDLD